MPETSESSGVKHAGTVTQPPQQDRSASKPDSTKPDPNKPDSPKPNDSKPKAAGRDLLNLVFTKLEPIKPDYRGGDVEQLKGLFKERGLALDGNKKQTLEWYRGKLIRDDAKATTYKEYKLADLKNELRGRGKDSTKITKKLQAIKRLEDDDKENGSKGPSMGSRKAHQPKGKPKPSKDKSDKPNKDSRRLSKERPTKPINKEISKPGENKDTAPGEQAAVGLTKKVPGIKPPALPAADPKGFTASMTAQVIGKPSEARAKPLTKMRSLPASYDPNLNLNVLGWLTIATSDDQFPVSASSERHIFQINSLEPENKKRKMPPLSNAGDDKPKSTSKSYDDRQEPKNPLTTRTKSPEDDGRKDTIPPKDRSLDVTSEKVPAATSATPTTAMSLASTDTTLTPPSSPSDPGPSLSSSPPPSPSEPDVGKFSRKEPRGSKWQPGSKSSGSDVSPSKPPHKPTSPKKSPTPRSKSDHDSRVRKSGSVVMGTGKGMTKRLRLANRGSTRRPRFGLVGAVRRSIHQTGRRVRWWQDMLHGPRRRPAVATSWGEWVMEYLHM